jgi:hypothetical protein
MKNMNQLMNEIIISPNEQAIAPPQKKANPNYAVDWAGLFKEYDNTVKVNSGNALSELGQAITLIHVFCSELEAQNAVREMQRQGLSGNQIEIVAKNTKSLNNSINWDHIAATVGWAKVMTAFGICKEDTWVFEEAVEDGKYLVLAIVSDRAANQIQHILKNIGHWVIAVY